MIDRSILERHEHKEDVQKQLPTYKKYYQDLLEKLSKSSSEKWRKAASHIKKLIEPRENDDHYWYLVWKRIRAITEDSGQTLLETPYSEERLKTILRPLHDALKEYADEEKGNNHVTGLPARGHYFEQFQELAEHPKGRTIALLFLDMDLLKPINDIYGHEVGDMYLKEMASRLCALSDALGDYDMRVFSYGGDEMCILLSTTKVEKTEIILEIQNAFENLLTPIQLPNKEGKTNDTTPSFSCGIVMMKDTDIDDTKTITRVADTLQYVAKTAGLSGRKNVPQHPIPSISSVIEKGYLPSGKILGARGTKHFSLAWAPYKQDLQYTKEDITLIHSSL